MCVPSKTQNAPSTNPTSTSRSLAKPFLVVISTMASAIRRFTPQRQAVLLNSLTVFFFVIALGLTIPSLVLVSFLTKNQLSIEVLPDALPKNEAVDNIVLPSVHGVDTATNKTTYKLRMVKVTEKERKIVQKPQHSTKRKKRKFKTGFPGFTNEPSVLCGGHSAPSCDKCPQGNGASWCNGECEWNYSSGQCIRNSKVAHLHPDYFRIIERYAFQPVVNQRNEYVNIIMVRAPFRGKDDEDLYNFYKDDILFLGISSFEAFPLKSPNPYSAVYESEYYLNMFPGFLHMMRQPEAHFPSQVQTILMSQSDFMLDDAINFGKKHENEEKIYDFVYSGGDQDVGTDCVGWASYNKNFSFVRDALEVMCSPEFNVTGVLVANKNKQGTKACSIPASCKGKIVQTSFLDQKAFFDFLSKARFAFLPQICDASPRVSTQALSMNIPLLMNRNIMGGWKYLLPGKTGEFFHDMSDFKESLRLILDNTRGDNSPYEPLDFVLQNYGNHHSGRKLFEFVKRNWEDKIEFPDGTELLLPTGA